MSPVLFAKTIARPLVLAVLLATATGCGVIDYFFLPPPEDTAQELFEAGNEAMREKRYDRAAEYFIQLKDRYPFSPYAVEAEMGLADAHYLDGEYELAEDAYKEFEALHPRHEQTPYVVYQIGMSNFSRLTSVDRPTTHITEALEYFYRLRDSYPDSEYADKAAEHIVACRRILAEHEVYVGDFYWQQEEYGAAWARYIYVVQTFSDIEDLAAYADRMAEMAYLRYRADESAEELRAKEGSWKDLFDWL